MRFRNENRPELKNISHARLQQMINAREKFTLIDVREKFERDIFNIGGLHIPLVEIPMCNIDLPEDDIIIVYCAHGKRSIVAAEYLINKFEFTNVYNLEGGIADWPR